MVITGKPCLVQPIGFHYPNLNVLCVCVRVLCVFLKYLFNDNNSSNNTSVNQTIVKCIS